MNQELLALRGAIDGVDEELARLFVRRMALAGQIGAVKRAQGMSVTDPVREREVLASRAARMPDKALATPAQEFFATLMRLSREQQARDALQATGEQVAKRAVVAYQGVRGAFGHQAALQLQRIPAVSGGEGDTLPCRTFEDVFVAVAQGAAAYGVLPLENSSAGGIADVYDLLAAHHCAISGELLVPVAHCLLGVPGASLDSVRAVYSHEQGFLQSREFLKKHPDWVQRPYFNTAISAQYVAEQGAAENAAIASRLAAECYGLEVLAADIQTQAHNTTRFVVITAGAPQAVVGVECNKATLSFALRHERGTLHRALAAFVALGMNLTRIESRPIPGQSWEYRFFVDIEGKLSPEKLAVLLEALEADCVDCRVLGHYPAAGRPQHGV